ncbi:MAG: chromosome segregation protein SMC [Cyclobacteriaceae bacterium]
MEENQTNNQTQNIEPAGRKNRTPVFIIITVILLGIVIFFFMQNKKLEEERQRQEQEISETYLRLDSISGELDQRIRTIVELGGEIDTLLVLKEQLENDKKSLLTRQKNQRAQISQLNERVSGYKELLLIKDEEINQLKIINEQLSEENTTLKVEKNELSASIQQLEQSKEELADKIEKASKLEITGLKVFAVSDKGREREDEFRNRHINSLKIQFTVLDNEIAPIEGKDLLLRITAPDGNVLFDVTRGSGSFTFEGRDLFYTATQEILYDRNRQLVTFMYDKGSDFSVGQHKVEVYTDQYLMGTGTFMVK